MGAEKTILVVDDAVVNRNIVKQIFKDQYYVIEASDGEQALELMKKYNDIITVVLLDIHMPKMDGFAVLNEVSHSSELAKLPIIAVTAEISSETLALKSGAWDFVTKPFNVDVIRTRVENAVNRRRLTEVISGNAKLEAKAQIYSYINYMPIAFFVAKTNNIDPDTYCAEDFTFEYCNNSYAELKNLPVNEIIGEPLTKFYRADVFNSFKNCFSVAVIGNDFSVDQKIKGKNPKYYSIYMYCPRKGYCACLIKDVTVVKNLEKKNLSALKRENKLLNERNDEQQKYEIIIKQTGAVIFEWDKKRKNFYCSENIADFDYDIGKGFETSMFNLSAFHPDDVHNVLSAYANAVANKKEKLYRRTIVENSVAFYDVNLTKNLYVYGDGKSIDTLGIRSGIRFDDLVKLICEKQIFDGDKKMFTKNISRSRLLKQYDDGNMEVCLEYRMKNKSGSFYWVESTFNIFSSTQNDDVYCTWVCKDIDSKKQYELMLKQRAERDALTGLYNCVSFQMMVEDYLKKNHTGTFYMLDVDNFKRINDTYGHTCGDTVLKSVADALINSFGNNALFARMGGDEFAVFVKDNQTRDEIESNAEQICKAINFITAGSNSHIRVSCSLGIAIIDNDSYDFGRLYANADKAQYFAKRGGKNRFAIFESDHQKATPRILIADDIAMHRDNIRSLLSDRYDVVEAEDGDKALSLLKNYSNPISLVILDNIMPKKTGLELLQKMKDDSLLCNIPTIMITMYSEPEMKLKALDLGAVYFIEKPFEPEIVSKLVDNIIKGPD